MLSNSERKITLFAYKKSIRDNDFFGCELTHKELVSKKICSSRTLTRYFKTLSESGAGSITRCSGRGMKTLLEFKFNTLTEILVAISQWKMGDEKVAKRSPKGSQKVAKNVLSKFAKNDHSKILYIINNKYISLRQLDISKNDREGIVNEQVCGLKADEEERIQFEEISEGNFVDADKITRNLISCIVNSSCVSQKSVATPVPLNFTPNEETIKFSKERFMKRNPTGWQLQKFINYYLGTDVRRSDWNGLYRNWLVRAEHDPTPGAPQTFEEIKAEHDALVAEFGF